MVKKNNQPRGKDGKFISNSLYEKKLDYLNNVMRSRNTFFNKIFELRRDTYKECGYPEVDTLDKTDFKVFFDREAIAKRVVTVLPEESWMMFPEIIETQESTRTPFEESWINLGNRLNGESWFRGDNPAGIWEYLKRADILSGIGTFGVMLLGFSDGEKDLSKPVTNLNDNGKRISQVDYDLNFIRVFDETLVTINEWEKDKSNPRFGLPKLYQLTVNDPKTETDSSLSLSQENIVVHWTRIHHVADSLQSSEVLGVPRMKAVYNRLYDLVKLYGGSAEMYWRGAFPGFGFSTQSNLAENELLDIDTTSLRSQIKDYNEGLQRFLLGIGLDIKSLSPQVVDPTPQIEVQIEAICIEKGIPKRVFMGSEIGERSSTQDEKRWNKRLSYRQHTYLTPRVIVPFIDRLILVGALPEPVEGYSVEWPDLNALDEQTKADIALKRTQAMVAFVQGNVVDVLMTSIDYLVKELNYSVEEAQDILESFVDPQTGINSRLEDFEVTDDMLDKEDQQQQDPDEEQE